MQRKAVLIFGLVWSQAAHADVLFYQPPILETISGPFSEQEGNQMADTFVPYASGTANLATFWGTYLNNRSLFNVGDKILFTLVIWDMDANGLPDQERYFSTGLATVTQITGQNWSNETLYRLEMPLDAGGVFLTQGQAGLVSILENDPNTRSPLWRWSSATGGDNYSAFKLNAESPWRKDLGHPNLAIKLENVPEPASCWALVVAGAAIVRKRCQSTGKG